MSELPKEIADALETIPTDLTERYQRLSDIIKGVEQALLERNVGYEAGVQFADKHWLEWSKHSSGWRLCARKEGGGEHPAIELPLSLRIKAVGSLPKLIRLLADYGGWIP